jgi:hypothetical protein
VLDEAVVTPYPNTPARLHVAGRIQCVYTNPPNTYLVDSTLRTRTRSPGRSQPDVRSRWRDAQMGRPVTLVLDHARYQHTAEVKAMARAPHPRYGMSRRLR